MGRQRRHGRGPAPPGGDGRFRIIGGDWRRRRLSFPALPGVRPTADRVRETLFNWLQTTIPGARCLDLFAGSGALGLEALSRGAAHVTFVDRSPPLIAAIEAHLGELGAGDRGHCAVADALAFLDGARGRTPAEPAPWDVVFLDPPFDGGLLAPVLDRLGEARLPAGARIYIEHGTGEPLPGLPAGWAVEKNARAGNVRYHLAVAGPARPSG
jgi:16S rRNA (guanine966-N2)-methyltransferase